MSERPVAFLGPDGTFTHAAALELAADRELVPVANQKIAIAGVESGEFSAAVVPVDNSVEGVVLPTWVALLDAVDVEIVDDTVVPISFNAFQLPGSSEPTVVKSHPHALAQCARYVDSLAIPTAATSSTAEACREIQPGELAIAAPICAELYGLNVVGTAVEDNPGARTQFALVARPGPKPASGRIGVLAVAPTANRAGVLSELLAPLSDAGLSLVNLVARRLPQSNGEYVFLFHIEGLDRTNVATVTAALADAGAEVASLGHLSQHVTSASNVQRSLPRRFGPHARN